MDSKKIDDVIIGFNTQPPEGGCGYYITHLMYITVSTHSRLKAAERPQHFFNSLKGFNTQPPEGGCSVGGFYVAALIVSTHSRLKAAGRHIS